jgi:hypothetical protein
MFSCEINGDLRKVGRERYGSRRMKFILVELIEIRDVGIDAVSEYLCKVAPENLGVRFRTVIFDHCARSLPKRGNQQILVIAARSHLFYKQTEVGFDEKIVIHREQRAVKIE